MSNYIIQNGELYHYGVLGMKWGVRKARAEAKANYKKAKRKAWNKYSKKVDDIDDKYTWEDLAKNNNRFSDEDTAAVKKARSDYKKEVAEAKADYKLAKTKIKDMKADTKLGRMGKEATKGLLGSSASLVGSLLVADLYDAKSGDDLGAGLIRLAGLGGTMSIGMSTVGRILGEAATRK